MRDIIACCATLTRATLQEFLAQYQDGLVNDTKKKPANYNGVNSHPLLDVDPQRILVPVLHTPMGLVDKILESFKGWIGFEVEHLNEDKETVRQQYRDAIASTKQTSLQLEEATLLNTDLNNAASLQVLKTARKENTRAKKEERKAKVKYENMIQQHNATLSSLTQQFEEVFRRRGVKRREYYHGGKYNGVNCI